MRKSSSSAAAAAPKTSVLGTTPPASPPQAASSPGAEAVASPPAPPPQAAPSPGPQAGASAPVVGVVEVDSHFDSENNSETDSGVPSGESSATTSITSSVFDFTYANGRRYHSGRFKKADYYMPNDEEEQSRLDLYHHLFLLLLGGALYTAPLDHPQRVLDVGTGTGIWAVDFADMHPEAEVIGNDISPIQPSWVPNNCKFEVDDVEEPWTYPDDYFDYVHMRSLSGSIKDWEVVLKNAYRTLQPGGWIEYQDYGCEGFLHDGTPLRNFPYDKAPAVGKWFLSCEAAAAKSGRPLVIANLMEEWFTEAGFVDIQVRKELWPLSTWPKDKTLKEIGRWALLGCMETVFPFAVMLLTKLEGWSEPEVKKLCDDAIGELTKGKQKFYGEAWFVSARKPENAEKEL